MTTTVLFEPLPIGRLGVRRADEEVVLGTDFSSFAYILEEFVALAVTRIAIPQSFAEVSAISQAPEMLRRRITIVNDAKEIESVERILHPIMQELEISINDNTGELKKPAGIPKAIFASVRRVRRDIRCLALGLNHTLQIDLDSDSSIGASRALRAHLCSPHARAILANIEAFFSYYEDLEFDCVAPSPDVPSEMLSIFDRLVNDPQYLTLSDSVAGLSTPGQRRRVLPKLRSLGRTVASSNAVSKGWNYVAKIMKVWTGVPIPESNTLSVLVSGKTLPPLTSLHDARNRAIEMWIASGNHDVLFGRSGLPIQSDEVDWLPPCPSVSASRPGDPHLSLGTTGELLASLKSYEKSRNN